MTRRIRAERPRIRAETPRTPTIPPRRVRDSLRATTAALLLAGVAAALATALAAAPALVAAPALAAAPAPAAGQAPAAAQEDGRSPAERAGDVVSMVDLTVTEYADAVADGEVVNRAEYREARQFLAQAARQLEGLQGAEPADAGPAALARLDTLSRLLEAKASPDRFRTVADRVSSDLAEGWGAVSMPEPPRRPSAARGAVVYRRMCASCHGAAGTGDGPEAGGLEPPPADLTAPVRRTEGTPARDFQVVSLGIPATSMAAYADTLGPQQRWDVVAYVQGLRYGAAEVAEGKALALGGGEDGESSPIAGRLRDWSSAGEAARLTDAGLARRVRTAWNAEADTAAADSIGPEAARSVVAYVRTLMGTPVEGVPEGDRGRELADRVDRADSLAAAAAGLAREGDRERATSTALRAYMAFEGVEPTLRGRAPDLVREVEAAFGDLRAAVGEEEGAVGPALERVRAGLSDARETVAEEATFWSLANWSFFIILREGFEAILILGAILAFLTKTENEHRKKDVWGGTAAALAGSVATAFAFERILAATPASREVLEGGTMLLAVVVLFSVSYWLLSKVEHRKWEQYLQSKMKSALGAGSGLALAGVAFLAVYREGFETVIFYAALLTRAGGELAPVIGGFLVGCVALAGIYAAITRLGVRMPMRPFFGATSGVLYLMAVVFAGSGIRELQEAGVVGTTAVAGAPTVGLLGVYPTVETLAAQGVLVALLLVALWITFGPSLGSDAGSGAGARATAGSGTGEPVPAESGSGASAPAEGS